VNGRRLASIDALRGVAALGVVLFHTNAIPGVDRRLFYGDAVDAAAFFGKFGVWLFFVISGFCIHLQWVRAKLDPSIQPMGAADFWKRRIRRLYPPYLVTLVFYVWLRHHLGELPFTALSAWKVGLHLVMLQNLDLRAMGAMNNVYWTLAVEEQLYLLYFVFLVVRRRWGWPATFAVVGGARVAWFAAAMLLHRVWHVDIMVTQAAAAQWIVWVLGALAVEGVCGLTPLPRWTRSVWVGGGALVVAGVMSWAQNYWLTGGALDNSIWLVVDVVWGIGFFAVLNALVAREATWVRAGRAPIVVAGLAWIGLFSYSLYLTHEFIEWRVWPFVASRLAAAGVLLPQIVVMAILAAACVAFARVFFGLFERPFLTRRDPSVASPLLEATQA